MKFNKWLCWLGVAIFSILTITFFWQECNIFCFKEKANTEKISQYFTAIGALLSGAGLILLAKQIKISEKVRRDSFRPDILPRNVKFILDKFYYKRINIFNGGNSIAKKIKYKWILNDDSIPNLVDNEGEILFLSIQGKWEIRLPDCIRTKLLKEHEDFNEFKDIDLGLFNIEYKDRENNLYNVGYKFKATQCLDNYEIIFYS